MTEVEKLEQQFTTAKILVDRKKAALRLAENRDFRELIVDGYMKTEAVRFLGQSSDPALTDVQRADALSMAQATSHLKRFLSMIVQMAAVSERDMEDLEEAIEEARREEAEFENEPALPEVNTSGELA